MDRKLVGSSMFFLLVDAVVENISWFVIGVPVQHWLGRIECGKNYPGSGVTHRFLRDKFYPGRSVRTLRI